MFPFAQPARVDATQCKAALVTVVVAVLRRFFNVLHSRISFYCFEINLLQSIAVSLHELTFVGFGLSELYHATR